MKADWQSELMKVVPAECLSFDHASRQKFSHDYFHFSPVLDRELRDEIADCIARPTCESELDAILSLAVAYQVPVTVRGAGTGNYGQAVPLAGGIVLDMSQMNRILGIDGDVIRAEAGARMGKMEAYAREHGKELRVYPSTFQTATIGGFVSGGSGGIGSIEWGTIWDGYVQGMVIKSIEENPRTLRLSGSEVEPYIHNYGVSGVVTELSISLATRHEWVQLAVSFDDYVTALRFGLSVGEDATIEKRLVSIHEWPIPSYFTPLNLTNGKAVALLEISEPHEAAVLDWALEWGGEISLRIPPSNYHRGIGVSDFTWNHTTLWARKRDPELTYLQARFTTIHCVAQMEELQKVFPECVMHVELMRNKGEITVSGLPILRYSSDERLWKLISFCEEIGVKVANPHTWRLEFGGRSPELVRLGELKRQNDPHGLLNPGKLELSLAPEQTV